MQEAEVPSGWSGIRSDFRHFAAIHGADDTLSRLWMLAASRAFWGLALYRFGRWIYAQPRLVGLPFRALYTVLFEIGRRLTKTSLSVRSRIEREVWIAPQGEVFISLGSRVGRGSMLHGGNTIGVGGRPPTRGHPQLGERVVMCPGATAVGPIQIADGVVIGPCALAGRAMKVNTLWMGVPSRPRDLPMQQFAPAPPLYQAGRRPRGKPMKPEYFWSAFRADLQRHLVYHPDAGPMTKLRLALVLDGSWAMALYRFGRRLRTIPPAGWAAPWLWGVYRFWELMVGLFTSISIDVDALIEPGFYVGHFVSLRIGPGVRIGKNSSVSQMCTLEGTGPAPESNAPVLGERVYLGAGAKVIGPHRLADGAVVCANSVVTEDVPENGVVLGNPGQVISRRGSGDFIYLGAGTGVRDALPEEVQGLHAQAG